MRSPDPDVVETDRRNAGRDNWRETMRPNMVGSKSCSCDDWKGLANVRSIGCLYLDMTLLGWRSTGAFFFFFASAPSPDKCRGRAQPGTRNDPRSD